MGPEAEGATEAAGRVTGRRRITGDEKLESCGPSLSCGSAVEHACHMRAQALGSAVCDTYICVRIRVSMCAHSDSYVCVLLVGLLMEPHERWEMKTLA